MSRAVSARYPTGCRKCGAKLGEPCRTFGGRTTDTHQARIDDQPRWNLEDRIEKIAALPGVGGQPRIDQTAVDGLRAAAPALSRCKSKPTFAPSGRGIIAIVRAGEDQWRDAEIRSDGTMVLRAEWTQHPDLDVTVPFDVDDFVVFLRDGVVPGKVSRTEAVETLTLALWDAGLVRPEHLGREIVEFLLDLDEGDLLRQALAAGIQP